MRVLEPSPPAVALEPWFADDPVAPGGKLSPLTEPGAAGPTSWDSWVAAHPQQADWAGPRWLMSGRSLVTPPAGLTSTRLALHRLGVYVVSPARRQINGKIGLRWTLGGFGTPFFGDDRQVRVVGAQLVCEGSAGSESEPISSLNAAARHALASEADVAWASGFDVPAAGDLDEPLDIDEVAATWLGDWFGFGNRVLEQLRSEHPGDTQVQLWPEHFDLAVSLPIAGATVTFGVSPGDAGHPSPYLYVLPGRDVEPGGIWNATGYSGAVLDASAVLYAPVETALEFFRGCIGALGG